MSKQAFLTEYRELCERHRMMVVHVDHPDYSPFAVAHVNQAAIDQQLLEMNLERIRNLRK